MMLNTVVRQIVRQTLGSQTLMRTNTLAAAAARYNSSTTTSTEQPTFNKEALEKLVRTNKVVVFMKGNPEAPRCGFSNAVVQIMRMHGVTYDAHDVLQSEELRQSVKEFSDWPTIPQVFINGEFVGGCDILLEMHQSGDLIEELKKAGIESVLLKAHAAAEAKKEKKQNDTD